MSVESNDKQSNMAMAEHVAASVDIAEVRQVHAHMDFAGVGKKLNTQLQVGHIAKTEFHKATNQIVVFASFGLKSEGEESDEHSSFSIDAKYRIAYTLRKPGDLSEEEIQTFGIVNGCYNCWPFWREYVYSTMSRMGLPPMTLPVFRYDTDAGKDADGDDSNT